MEELYGAAGSIREKFGPMVDCDPSLQDVVHSELSVREALKTIYANLYAMAIAELEMRSRSASGYFLSSVSYEFEEIAHMAAETPFSKRGADELLEITRIIIEFFSGEGEKGSKDLFMFLRGVTRNNLGQALKRISRSEKRLMHFVYTAVIKHVASSPRYIKRGEIVTDNSAPSQSTLRQATIFEITAACAPLLCGSEKPGELVDLVFDEICRKRDFTCHLHISTLRMAVFELIKTRFISRARKTSGTDPMQEYLHKETLALAREALRETLASYGWREGGSDSFQKEYGRAGWDILEEIIAGGNKISHLEALGRHIESLDGKTYRTTHKGSFQNFWRSLWESFLKKIRADY